MLLADSEAIVGLLILAGVAIATVGIGIGYSCALWDCSRRPVEDRNVTPVAQIDEPPMDPSVAWDSEGSP